jgi:lysophospholipase L1-like esterase
MKKQIVQFCLIMLCFSSLSAQTIQRFYLDFGPNNVTDGNNTTSPDVNGNYWNNINNTFTTYSLTNSQNKASGFSFISYTPSTSVGILNGGLLSPETAKLGDMAIATATQDFFYSSSPLKFKLKTLNINNGYKFYFFSSRDFAGVRSTNFDLKGMNTAHGTLKSSDLNLGGTGKNYNNSTFYVTDTIKPDTNGDIVINISPGVGGYAYLNMMKIEELDITDITSMEVKGGNISILNDSSQMTLTIKPLNASYKPVQWSVDDTTIAVIQNNGLLIPKKNGIVNVTASIIQNGSPMSASKKISICNQLSNLNVSQRLFFDFGPDDGANGNATINPDVNGNYWNNIIPTTTTSRTSLVNTTNQNTGFYLSSNSSLSANGIVNGGLLSPDVSKLGEMAVATATQDFFYTTTTGQMTMGGLNPSKGYRFFLFGSRDNSVTRTTTYSLNGMNNCSGVLQTSGIDLGGTGKNYNNSKFYATPIIIPDKNGEVGINLTATIGAAYLNMMRVEEVEIANITGISVAGEDINAPFSDSKMDITFLPPNATPLQTQWSVNDTIIATINAKGLLHPRQNGKVIVTASCIINSQPVSGSKEVSITNQITDIFVGGSAIPNHESQGVAIKMNKVISSSGILKGVFELSTTFKSAGRISFFSSQTDSNMPVFGLGESKGFIKIDGESITPGFSGDALVRIDLLKNTYAIYPTDTLKVTLMGSSVGFGVGATSYHGWFYQYGQLLSQNYLSNSGSDWKTSNICIPGNNTNNLLDRWDSDLLNEGSRYVIYGVSLGNEGIIGGGQAIFDQFKRNISTLISKAISVGKIPILTSCYGRNDYTTKEYNFTKRMNIIIAQLAVPSYNLFGALDNGIGIPVLYMSDTMHPNDLGHTELMYAIVPSLFDALKNKKQIPRKVAGTYLTMGKNVTSEQLSFTPENKVHSFTTTFDIKTTSTGIVSTFNQVDSLGVIMINNSGTLTYKSPNGGTITSQKVVNDGAWHKISLSHYYAWGMTFLYTDSIGAGNINEKVTASTFYINHKNAPEFIDYRDWMFYRAAMNSDEIVELNRGKLLKSSLELYSPLDGLSLFSQDTLINLAQSMNKLKRVDTTTAIESTTIESDIRIFPNPVTTKLNFANIDNRGYYFYSLYSIDGKMVKNRMLLSKNDIDVSFLKPNKYIVILTNQQNNVKARLEFLKK